MGPNTSIMLALVAISLAACSREAPPSTPSRPAARPSAATAPTPTPTPAPTDIAPPEAPAPPPAPEPDPARAEPLRARIQQEPDDAQARCELGWLYFEAGNLDVGETETRRGVDTLENDFRIADTRKRQTLGACLYNRGRIIEARARARTDADATRGGLTEALAQYERSLWYRDNQTVRSRWSDVAIELGRPGERPQSVPASLWTYASGRETEACGAPPEPGQATFGEDSTEGSCAVHIEAIGRGRERRQAAVISIGDYDDAGTPEQSWDDRGETSYELVTFDGQRWITRGPVYSVSDVDSTVAVEVRYQDVQPGGEPEVLVTVTDEWFLESEGDYETGETYGTHAELVVCGAPENESAMLCAPIVTRDESHGDDEERIESVAVRFLGEGRMTVRGRMNGERVREETTVAQLWASAIEARERAAAEAAPSAAAPPPAPPPVEITGAAPAAPTAPVAIPPSPAPAAP